MTDICIAFLFLNLQVGNYRNVDRIRICFLSGNQVKCFKITAINLLLCSFLHLRRQRRPPVLNLLLRPFVSRASHDIMDSSAYSYENAVFTLNNLQSNAQVIANVVKAQRAFLPEKNVMDTRILLECTGIRQEDLDSLKVIHVSGTKGKGSTCAFTEAMLRQYGFKTGFFSSPHLVHVRERIRINSTPISEAKFASYFWKVYALVEKAHRDRGIEMPAYFKFLTILAMHVFVHERVDVAVVEVGIGGEYDCTNIFTRPVVCGITTLDLDHCSILGNTVEQIAWNKAGIFKPGSSAVTVSQPPEAMAVLVERAEELNTKLYLAPPLPEYMWTNGSMPELGIAGTQQHTNVSLALQLFSIWMQRQNRRTMDPKQASCQTVRVDDHHCIPILRAFQPTERQSVALHNVKWPGRSQIVETPECTYFLDGAHTPLSIEFCVQWFRDVCDIENTDNYRVLLFQCTGDRCPSTLLPQFHDLEMDEAIFCPPIVSVCQDQSSDQANLNTSYHSHLRKSELCLETWHRSGRVENCITSAIETIMNTAENTGKHVQVLVTGSLHLVGGVLSILQTHEIQAHAKSRE